MIRNSDKVTGKIVQRTSNKFVTRMLMGKNEACRSHRAIRSENNMKCGVV
jgi:hypothetical protein